MNTLKRNNIKLNCVIAYVGLDRNFISIDDVLKDLDNEELEKLNEREISLLYSSDLNCEKLKDILSNISNINEGKYKLGLKIWGLSLLKDINQTATTISDKMKKVANLWADFDYIDDWKSFIYYMPVDVGLEVGEDFLNRNFLNYIESEYSKIDIYYKTMC